MHIENSLSDGQVLRTHNNEQKRGEVCADWRFRPVFLWVAVLLSVLLHTALAFIFDFHSFSNAQKALLEVRLVPPMKHESLPVSTTEVTDAVKVTVPPATVAAVERKPVPAPSRRKKTTKKKKTAATRNERESGPKSPQVRTHRSLKPEVPAVAPVTAAPDQSRRTHRGDGVPILLANESGLDELKHGSEARFMHGFASDEFVEDNYIGEFSLGKGGRVWIEDDRARSGHLILHAEKMGLVRPLFRFNRFIYTYGVQPGAPKPIGGTVTFFSDGYTIHQFLWEHNSSQAFYPMRTSYRK